MPDITETQKANLSATYDSPSGHKDFVHTISTPQVDNNGAAATAGKTKYLSELRTSTKKLQEEINKFLTEKMEEDKKAVGEEGQNGTSKQKSEDELEEENYGEENMDET